MWVDGKISTDSEDELDEDRDFPNIPGVREGLHQYYGIDAYEQYIGGRNDTGSLF